MTQRILILLFIFLAYSCKKTTPNQKKEIKTNTLTELFGIMQGSYNSEIQSEIDSSYYNISLHMYPIWKTKGNYLYVEQALNSMQDKPYRQRIYEITQINDSTFKSAIYTLPIDSVWVGKWKTPQAFDTLQFDKITLKDGCEVILSRIEPNYYIGKTGQKTCESNLRGASYATSEVEVFEDKIISWDRGFDTNGTQVWGAEKGGYIFNKLD